MAALTAVGATTSVSLANFTPRIENLPSTCQSVYVRAIRGCQESDFTDNGQGKTCSASCVTGLVEIQKAIQTACGSVDVPETSIIGVFLLGSGIPILCPNIVVTTIGGTPTMMMTSQAPQTTTSPTDDGDGEETTTAATTSTSESTTETTTTNTSSSSSGIAIDTTVPTTFTSVPQPPANTNQPQASSSSSSAKTSSTASSQKSNADSGGGSPFDVVATGSAAASQISWRSVAISTIAAAIAIACAAL